MSTCCSWRLNSLSSSMRLCSTRLRDDVIKPMHQLMSQLAIKSLERESISEAFFRCIRSMTIYSVSIFVKADSTTWVSHAFFAALKLSMICLLKLRKQLTLTAASAVFALTAVFTMILAATSVLTLRAASALTLSEDFFVDEMLERMSEFSRDSFWLRRDDNMMTSRIKRGLKEC